MIALLFFLATAQTTPAPIVPSPETTPVQPLPPANPLPLATPDVANVLAPIQRLFAGVTAGDRKAVLAETRPDGGATVAIEAASGPATIRHMSWTDFAAGIATSGAAPVERLTDPAVEIDGDIAMVWNPYVVTVAGKVSRCGTDHVDLVHDGAGWRILNLTWTQRTTGCPA